MYMSKVKDSEYIITDSGYYILLSLLTPNHGYGIMKYVEEITEGEFVIGPATLYTTLKKMQKSELIKLQGEGEERKKIYEVTALGKEVIYEEVQRRIRMAKVGQIVIKSLEGGESNE